MGWGEKGDLGSSDMASGYAGGEERRENSRLLTGLRIRKAYLRGLAVRQDAVPLVCATLAICTRERETELHGEEHGEERRATTTHAITVTARISQQRCPNMTVPHEP